MPRSATCVQPRLTPAQSRQRKKTSEAIRQEVTHEVDRLLRIVFTDRRKTGRFDWEATEMAVRSAMHHAGAAGLTELLQFAVPAAGQRTFPCSCGQQARYLGYAPKLPSLPWVR